MEALGAGLALDGDNATVDEIVRAVRRVMSDLSYFAMAGRRVDGVSRAPGPERAASLLERIA